jgi:hypothetical protein
LFSKTLLSRLVAEPGPAKPAVDFSLLLLPGGKVGNTVPGCTGPVLPGQRWTSRSNSPPETQGRTNSHANTSRTELAAAQKNVRLRASANLRKRAARTCWLLVMLKASAMWQEDRFAQEKIGAIFELCCRISLAGRLIHKPRHRILLIADKREKDRLLGPERNQELRRLLVEENR